MANNFEEKKIFVNTVYGNTILRYKKSQNALVIKIKFVGGETHFEKVELFQIENLSVVALGNLNKKIFVDKYIGKKCKIYLCPIWYGNRYDNFKNNRRIIFNDFEKLKDENAIKFLIFTIFHEVGHFVRYTNLKPTKNATNKLAHEEEAWEYSESIVYSKFGDLEEKNRLELLKYIFNKNKS